MLSRTIATFSILILFAGTPARATDPLTVKDLEAIAIRLNDTAPTAGYARTTYRVRQWEIDGVNAQRRGRIIEVTPALLRAMPNADALAFVIAHEMGHHLTQTEADQRRGEKFVVERLADHAGLRLLHAAGYRLEAAIEALDVIEGSMTVAQRLFRAGDGQHPPHRKRLRIVRELIDAVRGCVREVRSATPNEFPARSGRTIAVS